MKPGSGGPAKRGDGDAVHEEAEIEGVRSLPVRQLPDEREPVRLVARQKLRCQPVGGLEVGQSKRDTLINDSVPEHVKRSSVVDLSGHPLEEPGLGIISASQPPQTTPRKVSAVIMVSRDWRFSMPRERAVL